MEFFFDQTYNNLKKSKLETLLEDFILTETKRNEDFILDQNVLRLEHIMQSCTSEQIKHNEFIHNSIEVLVAKMENMVVHQKMLEIWISQYSSTLRHHEIYEAT